MDEFYRGIIMRDASIADIDVLDQLLIHLKKKYKYD